jgi:hypothetical protein
MVPPTRRRLLQVATAVTAGLAGCGGLSGNESSSSRTVSENAGSMISGENSETDPDTVRIRTDTSTPPIRSADADETPTTSDRRKRRSLRPSSIIVDEQSRADELVVTDSADEDSVSSFLSATDFDSETIYVETRSVQECFRLQLCGISWDSGEIRTGYVRQTRPYDERCSVDKEVFESRLIRIPAALDREEVNSYGSSMSEGGQCHGDRPGDAEGMGGSDGSTITESEGADGGEKR